MKIKANKNLNILLQVCDYTGYEVSFKNDWIICTDTYGSDNKYEYNSVENALIDWLDTMIEQQENADMWKKEIEYVEQLKIKALTDWIESIEGYVVEEVIDNEIMVLDYYGEYGDNEEYEIIVKSIKDWCLEFIKIIEHKRNMDISMEEYFQNEIDMLKNVGNI